MAKGSNYEIEIDNVVLDVWGWYESGEEGDYEHPSYADYFELSKMFMQGVDVTDLLCDRIDEIEEAVIDKYYR
jgi:hypothetical protein